MNPLVKSSSSTSSAWLSLLWLAVIPVLNIFYGLLNRPGDQVFSLVTDLDRLTPFVPVFIIPYVLWYAFVPAVLIGLAFRDRVAYFRTLLALCGGLIVAYLIYSVFQTTVPRPDNLAETGILNRIVGWVYQHDQPFNCFPSIHVLTSYLMYRGASAFRPKVRWACAAMSFLIILSTLLIKQHVLADVVGGILVGELVFRSAGRRHSWKGGVRHVSAK